MGEERVHVAHVRTPEGMKDYVTLLPPDTAFSVGLVREAVVGQLLTPWEFGTPCRPESFVPNPAFVEVMHAVIARESPDLPRCQAEARRIGDGFLYVIDQRTATPDGAIPPEDVIGAFAVKSAGIPAGSYRRNPNHRLLSTRGFFRLDRELRARLVQELESLSRVTS